MQGFFVTPGRAAVKWTAPRCLPTRRNSSRRCWPRDTPVHPAPRIALWLMMTFALIALLWAVFGHIDVVATAQGKIVPNAGSKLIQPIETAAVKVIHVIDGQAVKAGQVLVELDATAAAADVERLRNEALTARLEASRAQALIVCVGERHPAKTGCNPWRGRGPHDRRAKPGIRPTPGIPGPPDAVGRPRSRAAGQKLHATQEQVAKLEQTAPIARQRAED